MSNKQKNIININRKKISSEDIKKQENFDGILNKHQRITKRPVYIKKRFYFILFVLLLIAYLIYHSEKVNQEKTKTELPS